MAFRAAGMSDSSDDDFDFQIDDSISYEKLHDNDDDDHDHDDECKKNDKAAEEAELKKECEINVLTACMTGNIDIIEEYISLGHNVDDFLHTGWTLLLYASSAVKPEVVEYLLSLGADANKHKDGYTPLMAVCDSTKGTTEQTLKCISLLLEARADPNATNKDRRTALMCACRSKAVEVVTELLKHIKNIDTCDNEGRTAIFDAVTANKPDVVKVLIKNKASVTVIDRRNLTVKDIANTKNYTKILGLLEFDDKEIDNYCPVFTVKTWRDALASINHSDPDSIDPEIVNFLFAMNLEKHRQMFKGMSSKTFLQLTQEDLIKMGMDSEHERQMFLNGLRKFHAAPWKPTSIRVAKSSSSQSLFDGVAAIINITRQLAVIGATFGYIRKNLMKDDGSGMILDKNECNMIRKELEETEKILALLKKDLNSTLKFAEKVKNNSQTMLPPSYIGPKNGRSKISWTTIMTFTVLAGILMTKTSFIQRLWN
ncbi:ankyrin repeat, SAM and basic leucine zipper domain-containing protein 1 [Chelonus insularis]|uniref:ankyrin repeat, SAM and basic leucine zipper domain-containing protein 1 n=1 Tax=Chelonus insularis TaxID=460826 RepID=UPI00158B9DB5|nr:ankyrin repeat, SAM and basic leucine zipper domain-containing protein 1-like [Chelonus insularis]